MENKEKLPQNVLEEQAMRDNAIARVNKKVIIICAVAFVAILVGAGIWYFVHQNNVAKANEALGEADIEMNDSIQLAKYKAIADAGSNKPNERARLMVAIKYYQAGKYKEALEYLDKASVDSEVISVGIESLKGDCNANLGNLDGALACYSSALDEADGNPQLVPFILMKQANVYRAQKKYDKEYECYSTIRTDYPGFMPDVEKYYERAKTEAGK